MLGDLAKKLFHSLIANEIYDLNCIFFFFFGEFRLDYPVNVSIYNFKTLYFCIFFFIVYLFIYYLYTSSKEESVRFCLYTEWGYVKVGKWK